MNKRLLCVITAAVLIVSVFSSCSAVGKNESEHKLVTQSSTKFVEDSTNFKLSYSQSDSLNPYKSQTLNNQILQELVFDSLFTVDENYDVQPSVATSYAYTNGKTLVVTIPSGLKFSDGGDLTASSVVYSFNQAKNSPHWKNSLDCISSASEQSATEIKFNLKYENPNAQNLLTFAISNGKTDKSGYAIGSGRYKYAEGGGEVYLEVNKQHQNFKPHIVKILLINVTAEESIENAVNIGNISYAFRDLSSGNKKRLQCNKKSVSLNNLVYIGVNNKSGITSNQYIRNAISLAASRETFVKSSYQSYAKAATSVFNPSSKMGKATSVFDSKADTAGAKQAIAQSGYSPNKLKLTILVSSNPAKQSVATLLKQQLEAVGFSVSIDKENAKNFSTKVSNNNFDIYIGETKVSSDMNLYTFFTEKGSTHYGIDISKSKTAKSYESYMKGDSEIGKFVIDFSEEMPFIPLVYRQGMICYSRLIQGDMQGYATNCFSNIEDWYFN